MSDRFLKLLINHSKTVVNNYKKKISQIECLAYISAVKNEKTLYKRLFYVVLYISARKKLP